MEQRQVVIEDLPSETLVLLKRDGKLNDATIRKLVKMGKLPDENGKYSNSGEVKGSNTNSNTPSNTRTTTRSGASSNPSSTPTTTKTESTDETVKSTKMKRKAKKKK